MAGAKSRLFRAGLSLLHRSGLARALQGVLAGKGAILMLHRVRPASARSFDPEARLSITPEYLASLITSFRSAGVDIVDLDEARRRVCSAAPTRRFVSFTFDDGYRDTLEHAAPIFWRHAAPFTVYATTAFVQRTAAPWWCVLEHVVARVERVRWWDEAGERGFDAREPADKAHVYAALSRAFFRMASAEQGVQVRRLADAHGLRVEAVAAQECCGLQELQALRTAGATIGCHTVSHPVLSLEAPQHVHAELSEARRVLEVGLDCEIVHLAYPHGQRAHVGPREFQIARRLGFATATTTRRGLLFAEHAAHLHAWPRVEVTPSFAASPHYLHTILRGLPVAARNRGRRVITA